MELEKNIDEDLSVESSNRSIYTTQEGEDKNHYIGIKLLDEITFNKGGTSIKYWM